MSEDISKRIIAAIREVTGNDSLDITESSHLTDDLGMDSVDFASLLMEIEEKFDGSVDDSELDGLKTVADVVELVKTKFTSN